MNFKKIYGWDGFELTSGDVTVGITPCIGGRIMSLCYQGKELLFVDRKHSPHVDDPTQWHDLAATKKSFGFRLFGGDKTWVAPQDQWLLGIPPLDLDAAPYALTWEGEVAVMTSAVCRETGLQVVRRVGLSRSQVNLTEELYNRTGKPLLKGLWNVTQINKPCFFEIPAAEGTFRSYHRQDKTLPAFKGDLSVRRGQLSIECKDNSLFKVGGMPRIGEVMIRIPGDICWKKTFNYEANAKYAHQSAVEVFNSPNHPYAEIEIHAPFKVLNPGECVRLEQSWQISTCSSKY